MRVFFIGSVALYGRIFINIVALYGVRGIFSITFLSPLSIKEKLILRNIGILARKRG